ncbi:MAG: MerR family transcriptional regulator [Bacteroidetes bacterium]|nr:MerR family transcriptional regulator [Bacteroidota bacterium]
MGTDKMIPTDEFCLSHNIAFSVINQLNASGLIDIISIEERVFISENQLAQAEKMIRLHVDLGINMEGIETISNLLQKMEQMQMQILALTNKLGYYEGM